MSRVRRLALISTSFAVAASGMLTATTSAADATTVTKSHGINVYIAKSHNIAMTQNLHPGGHKFIVRSGGQSSFQLLRPAAGYTKSDVVRDVRRGVDGGHVRALERFEDNVTLFGGVSSSPGHPGVLWLHMPAGRYWAVDTSANRTVTGMILTLHVGGARVSGGTRATATIRAVHEADWARDPRTIGHQGRLRFRNDSKDNHFLILARLADGKTMKDFAAWVEKAKQGVNAQPPIDFSASINTGVVSPGHQMTQTYSLPAGRYVMLCFWPDAEMGGVPHVFMGMYRGIRLT